MGGLRHEADVVIGRIAARQHGYYRAERVALEYDSRQIHDNPKRFTDDRRKIAYLAGRGILTVPLTANDLNAGANRAMADLRATLARRRGAA